MTKAKLGESLKKGREFPETLSTKELIGKVFILHEFREVTTQFGDRRIASISVNGADERVEAWLSGAVLDGQLDQLLEDDLLPATVKLTTDPDLRGAYTLEEPGPGEAFDAEMAIHNAG